MMSASVVCSISFIVLASSVESCGFAEEVDWEDAAGWPQRQEQAVRYRGHALMPFIRLPSPFSIVRTLHPSSHHHGDELCRHRCAHRPDRTQLTILPFVPSLPVNLKLMPLTMRPTGLGSGTYKKDADYSVFCGEWCIGRIYDNRTGPEDMRWFWALHAPSQQGTLRISNQVVTLEIAKVEAWAKLEEVSRRKNSRFKRRIKKPESTPFGQKIRTVEKTVSCPFPA
jgi:hypothetical protein